MPGWCRTFLRVLLGLAAFAALLYVIWPNPAQLQAGSEDPTSVTVSRMPVLYMACEEYKKKIGTWPRSMAALATLVKLPGTNFCFDGWGRPIVLAPATNAAGAMWLISYGADGSPGGTSTNGDIVYYLP